MVLLENDQSRNNVEIFSTDSVRCCNATSQAGSECISLGPLSSSNHSCFPLLNRQLRDEGGDISSVFALYTSLSLTIFTREGDIPSDDVPSLYNVCTG